MCLVALGYELLSVSLSLCFLLWLCGMQGQVDPWIPRSTSQSALHPTATSISVPAISLEGQGKPLGHFLVQRSRSGTFQAPNQPALGGTSWEGAVVEGAWVVLGPQEVVSHAQCHHCHQHSPAPQGVPPHPHQLSLPGKTGELCQQLLLHKFGGSKGKSWFFFWWMGAIIEG